MTKKILLIASLLFVSIGFSQEKWTLKKCVEYALENNISIKQNALNISIYKKYHQF
jgi:outer membrane protein